MPFSGIIRLRLLVPPYYESIHPVRRSTALLYEVSDLVVGRPLRVLDQLVHPLLIGSNSQVWVLAHTLLGIRECNHGRNPTLSYKR